MQLMNFKEANCKNCYKCVRACPVKAIQFQGHQAVIVEERCIACGQCFLVCPQNARDLKSDLEKVLAMLQGEDPVTALIAPSFAGFYENKGGFVHGLKALGFSQVVEVSRGAEEVTRAYAKIIEQEKPTFAISSCCPTVNFLIRRYYEDSAKDLLPVVSPMMATGKALKEESSQGKTVFISPCLSKKCEPLMFHHQGIIDGVLTMEEVAKLFQEAKIDVETLSKETPEVHGNSLGHRYPIKGGIGQGLQEVLQKNGYDILHVEGISQVREVLEELQKGHLSKAFIELNACKESCISGPCVPKNAFGVFQRKQLVKKHGREGWPKAGRELSFEQVDLSFTYARTPFVQKTHTMQDIQKTLKRMGKVKEKEELNCGACGYDTCREKAMAVLEGMADVEMCMPFMRTRAEHMNDIIFYNSPNMIFILDEELSILQMNPSAEKVFGEKAEVVKGYPVAFLLREEGFKRVQETGVHALNKRVSYKEHGLVVMQSIIDLPKDNQILVIMSDITEEERKRKELLHMKRHTVEITDKVIEKQMRVAHEIASLLGETTAETKIALNKLKALVMEEGAS